MPDSIRRFVNYLSRHGVRATAARIGLSWQRVRAGNRFVIYSCNLREFQPTDDGGLVGGSVERRNTQAEIPPADLDVLLSNWVPAIARKQMAERFLRGASLWELKLAGKLAGYGWTLVGGTMEPYFFPLEPDDVHLFDYFVFPEFRGRRINPALVKYILSQLKLEMKSRAFIEAAEWNAPQLSSLGRMPFRRVGKAAIRRRAGKTIVIWNCPE